MVWCDVCFALCVSPSVGLEFGFPVPSAGFQAALQEQNKKAAKPHVRATEVLLKHAFCSRVVGFKNKRLGVPGIFKHIFVGGD